MDLQWPHRLSLMPLSPTYSALDPLQSGFVPSSTLYSVGRVLASTRMNVEDPADGVEDPGYGPESLMDNGEPLDGLEKP